METERECGRSKRENAGCEGHKWYDAHSGRESHSWDLCKYVRLCIKCYILICKRKHTLQAREEGERENGETKTNGGILG